MAETKRAGMEHLTRWLYAGIAINTTAIERITGDWSLHRRHMHANLVGPAGFNAHFSQAPSVGEAFHDVPVRGCIFSVNRLDCHFFTVYRVPADRGDNPAVMLS